MMWNEVWMMKRRMTAVLTSIEALAFRSCTNLTIPDSVTSIGMLAFENCTSLTIYGKSGSCAEACAEQNNIPFKTGVSLTPTPQVTPYSPGDVTGDSTINAKDANAILRYAAAAGTGKATKITDYI